MASNPRYANGAARRRIRKWVLANFDHCALCGKPVDMDLPHTHPMAPEVDEILPVSLGGSPYSKDNVQLVHRICNQRKGNRVEYRNKPATLPLPRSRDW